MKTLQYDNQTYWQVTDTSFIRPHCEDRVKVLTIDPNGSIKCLSHKVKPDFRATVASIFVVGGIV